MCDYSGGKMADLYPTFWRTCRVLANENRLRLLWKLFRDGECSVSRLGAEVGLSQPVASAYLRAINSRGLILFRRRENFVLYRPEPNPEVEGSEQLLNALRGAYEEFMPLNLVFQALTAFTHERRISMVQMLKKKSMDEAQLSVKTGIPLPSLHRHLRKLQARNVVAVEDDIWFVAKQESILKKELLAQATGN